MPEFYANAISRPNESELRGYRCGGEATHPGSPLERRVGPHYGRPHWRPAAAGAAPACGTSALSDGLGSIQRLSEEIPRMLGGIIIKRAEYFIARTSVETDALK